LRGSHQARNAAFAIAVAGTLGADVTAAAAALDAVVPAHWRMEVHRPADDLVVINDAYNANPASMAAALDALSRLDVAGRRIAVLGDMRELGPHSAEAHRALAERAAGDHVDYLVAVGPEAAVTAARAAELGVAAVAVADAHAALDAVRQELRSGDAVLVKGSRAVGLDAVARALVEGDE
jgi:UDP-N-acetylmuramoyl-tripeptide--D-alanyl-D-alanine ligase